MVGNELWSVCPACVRIGTIVGIWGAFIPQAPSLTVLMIASELSTVHQIVTQDFNMRTVCAKMVVPKNVNGDQISVKLKCWQKCLNSLELNQIF
jgi:hypothetical protein